MKKKVLSALLAVSMFVGMAIPAFAAFPISSQAGLDEEITSLKLKKSEYAIENGKTANLGDGLIAYCGNNKIAQDPALEWSIADNTTFAIDNLGVVTNLGEDTGAAKVTVTANEGKVKAEATVKATKATKAVWATGFKFASSKFDLVENGVGANTIKVAPTPSGSKFDADQAKAIAAAINGAVVDIDENTNLFPAGAFATDNMDYTVNGDNELVFDVDLTATAKNDKLGTLEISVNLPKHGTNNTYAPMKRTTKIAVVEAVEAATVIKTGSIDIEVGQTFDASKKVAFGPTKANVDSTKALDYAMTLYNENSTTEDYAVLDSKTVLGVAVGKCKVVATANGILDTNGNPKTVEIIVNVHPKGALAKNDIALSAEKAEIAVGETYWLEVKNAPSDANQIKWTVSEGTDVVTIEPTTGVATKVFAKKAGTAVVTATYGETVLKFNVTVKAAGATTDKPGTGSNNPQTGDSWFTNLF